MSFDSYIENLRNKPEDKRRRYQFISALVVTLLVAGFWFLSFTSDVKVLVNNSDYEKPSPFRVMADSFKGVFQNIGKGAEVTKDKITGGESTIVNEDANLIYIKE